MQTAATGSSTSADSTGTHWIWRGLSVYYVRAGQPHPDRPPLLLVHGFGASTDHWRKNIQGLSPDFEVWAIDLLGFGRSTKGALDYGAILWRDQLQDFIAEVIGRPTVLAGNSLGGYAALTLAAQCPESAAGLILLNPAGLFNDSQTDGQTGSQTAKPDPVRQVLSNLSRSVLLMPLPSWLLFQYVRQKSMIRQTLEKVYLDQTAITDELIENIYRPSCDPGAATAFAAVFKSPQGEKNDVLLSQLACPLLMLWGEGDPWMNGRARGAKFREHYPQLTEYYLQAGHCPHDEVPDQVNALIRDWVINLSGKAVL